MKNGVKNIQTAGYNGARTVYGITWEFLGKFCNFAILTTTGDASWEFSLSESDESEFNLKTLDLGPIFGVLGLFLGLISEILKVPFGLIFKIFGVIPEVPGWFSLSESDGTELIFEAIFEVPGLGLIFEISEANPEVSGIWFSLSELDEPEVDRRILFGVLELLFGVFFEIPGLFLGVVIEILQANSGVPGIWFSLSELDEPELDFRLFLEFLGLLFL